MNVNENPGLNESRLVSSYEGVRCDALEIRKDYASGWSQSVLFKYQLTRTVEHLAIMVRMLFVKRFGHETYDVAALHERLKGLDEALSLPDDNERWDTDYEMGDGGGI